MLLRGYTSDHRKINLNNLNNLPKKSYKSVDKKYIYNPRYEPIRGSDIFCEFFSKLDK